MPQLNNISPFAARTALLYNEDGVDTLYVMVKATFNIGKALTLADEQIKPMVTDVYWTAVHVEAAVTGILANVAVVTSALNDPVDPMITEATRP